MGLPRMGLTAQWQQCSTEILYLLLSTLQPIREPLDFPRRVVVQKKFQSISFFETFLRWILFDLDKAISISINFYLKINLKLCQVTAIVLSMRHI